MAEQTCLTNRWDFYPCYFDASLMSIRLDMGVDELSEEQLALYPHTFLLDIPYDETNENGLPTQAELQRINQAEDSFYLGELPLYLLGVITGMGFCRFVFCLGACALDQQALTEHLVRDLAEGTHYRAQLLEHDNFKFFREFLLPDESDRNWMRDAKVCHNLQENGDPLTAPRLVDFYLSLPTEQALPACRDELVKLGFTPGEQQQLEDGAWQLACTRQLAPALNQINPLTEQLMQLAEGLGGHFDGWGAPLILK